MLTHVGAQSLYLRARIVVVGLGFILLFGSVTGSAAERAASVIA
jgi:hypothetical protein